MIDEFLTWNNRVANKLSLVAMIFWHISYFMFLAHCVIGLATFIDQIERYFKRKDDK